MFPTPLFLSFFFFFCLIVLLYLLTAYELLGAKDMRVCEECLTEGVERLWLGQGTAAAETAKYFVLKEKNLQSLKYFFLLLDFVWLSRSSFSGFMRCPKNTFCSHQVRQMGHHALCKNS